MSTGPFTYTAYGLTIQSEVECPELLPTTAPAPDDGLSYRLRISASLPQRAR